MIRNWDAEHGWFKMPSFGSPRKPRLAKVTDEKPTWCNRHHVVLSRCNTGRMKRQRLYFDAAPLIQVRDGRFEDIAMTQPDEWDDPDGHASRMSQRLRQFPTFAADMNMHKWKRKTTPVLKSLIPICNNAPKVPLSHSFPSSSDLALEAATAAGRSRTCSADGIAGPEPPFGRGPKDSHDKRHLCSKRKKALAGLPLDKQEPLMQFQEWAEVEYGHMLALWRHLDKDGSMTITKAEFLKGVKEMGDPRKAAILWSIFDSDGTGCLSISEFVPVAALQLARFRHWAIQKFGTVQGGFRYFDHDRNGKMTMQEFVHGCQAEDFPSELHGSVRALFAIMDDGRGAGKTIITEDEMAFLDAWKCPEYLCVEPDFKAKAAFQQALAARYGGHSEANRQYGGNHIIAWLRALDKDRSMRVFFSEFVETCRNLAKQGVPEALPACGVSALFCAIDRCRRGWFTLRDWHEESFNLLTKFTHWAHEEYPKEKKISNCFKNWDTNHSSEISLGNFKSHVQTLDMTSDEKDYLFEGISLQVETWSEDKGRYAHGTLTRGELVFLDAWDPDGEEQEAKAWDDQLNRSPTPGEETSPQGTAFSDFSKGPQPQMSRAWGHGQVAFEAKLPLL